MIALIIWSLLGLWFSECIGSVARIVDSVNGVTGWLLFYIVIADTHCMNWGFHHVNHIRNVPEWLERLSSEF